MTDPDSETCPLCDAHGGRVIQELSADRIWEGLRTDIGALVDDDVVARHLPPGARVWLLRCRTCALEYFAPSVPGDAEFYDRVTQAFGYEGTRWEFEIVAPELNPSDRVLDLGCGSGAFLRRATGRVRATVGVDHNAAAISELRQAGIEGHTVPFSEFARHHPIEFDVVSSFHTLEHLPRVADLIEPASACLRPGGRLYLSVPNRDRAFRPAFEALDVPPHHLTRWGADQFESIAERFALRLERVEFEQPDRSEVKELVKGRIASTLRLGGSASSSFAPRALAKLAVGPRRYARIARRRGYTTGGMFGHSMLAQYSKPPDA